MEAAGVSFDPDTWLPPRPLRGLLAPRPRPLPEFEPDGGASTVAMTGTPIVIRSEIESDVVEIVVVVGLVAGLCLPSIVIDLELLMQGTVRFEKN